MFWKKYTFQRQNHILLNHKRKNSFKLKILKNKENINLATHRITMKQLVYRKEIIQQQKYKYIQNRLIILFLDRIEEMKN